MPKTYVADPDAPVVHALINVEHSVIDAFEAVYNTAAQGPPSLVRCSCGVVIRWEDEGNFYDAAAEHFGSEVAARL